MGGMTAWQVFWCGASWILFGGVVLLVVAFVLMATWMTCVEEQRKENMKKDGEPCDYASKDVVRI